MRQAHVPFQVTGSTKLQRSTNSWSAQRSPELALKSAEFRASKNLIFPALHPHFPYQGQTFLQFKHFPSHLYVNHCQPQQHLSTQNVKIFCLIFQLLHQNFKHLHHHPFTKCFLHCSRQLLTICCLPNQRSTFLHQLLCIFFNSAVISAKISTTV